ncbi:hypothetical protein B0F90DRAFT_1777963, partial [Multifurca ochricompacta]
GLSLFSKPPGGRFFNSSKPPKVVPPASAKSAPRVEAAGTAKANNDPQQQASSSSPDDPSAPPSPLQSPPSSPSLPIHSLSAPAALASHPPLSAPDLRLHRFFAQHRPLVLSQPASALFDASQTLTIPEADADTARLLARAQVMNTVSSSVAWEATLRRLGLNPADGREAETAELEGLAVQLDSTRRKRRKKMKKHKCVNPLPCIILDSNTGHRIHFRLRKRRRVRFIFSFLSFTKSSSQLQRAHRLKIGR